MLMNIESIFTKDINRPINGVIKADQRDKAYNELEEYVITKDGLTEPSKLR